jgi:hypothetical protein
MQHWHAKLKKNVIGEALKIMQNSPEILCYQRNRIKLLKFFSLSPTTNDARFCC